MGRHGAVALHLRRVARTRWRSLAAVALLFGLTAGLSISTWASARRTSSAYDRMLEDTRATDLSVDYGVRDPEIAEELDRLPGVASSSSYVAFIAAPWVPGSGPGDSTFETVGSLDGRYFDQDRVIVVRGRMPDPSRVGEVAVNAATIERDHIDVGERFQLGVVTDEDLENAEDPSLLEPRALVPVEVVGEVLFGDEVIQDDNDVITRVLTTPAFTREHVDLHAYAWQGLALEPGADVDRVDGAARRVIHRGLDSSAEDFVLVRSTAEDRARVDRAILPQVSALLIAAALTAAIAVILVTQAAARVVRSADAELRTYRALGASPRRLTALAVLPPVLAIATGAVLAVVFAVAVSPLSPFGALHRAEPDHGAHLDAVAVLAGVAAILAVAVLLVAIAGEVAVRRLPLPDATRVGRPNRIVATVQRTGLPPSVTAGVRAAIVPTPGRGSAPIRSIAVGTIVATAALVAALCFGASLTRLVDEPELYGWNWDVAILDDGGYGELDLDETRAALDDVPGVSGWTGLGLSSAQIDDRTVPLVGIDADSGVEPTVLDGRGPRADDEVALGSRTMRLLGVSRGDTVALGPTRSRLTVVGTVSLPAVGQVHSSHPSPGEGAVVTLPTMADIAGLPDSGAGISIVAIRFRPGVDRDAVRDQVAEAVQSVGAYPGSNVVIDVPRPAEIVNARSVVAVPTMIAGVLMATALVSLGLALVGNVRRRHDELVTLRALGFTRRQLSTSVLTQSVVVTALGVLIGVPVGIVLGRWSWSAFAARLSVLDRPAVPLATLGVTLAAIVAIALLASIAPARLAARVRVADRHAPT